MQACANDLRILLIDDEESQNEITKLNLESIDPSFNILTSSKPTDAFILLQEQSFDCIVSDYQMPEINGIQLCAEVRKTSTIPFIIYTGHGSEEVASAAFAAGVDDYVRKERELGHYQVLARRIRHAIERKRAEAEVERLASFPLINPNPVIEADSAGKIYYTNPAAIHEFPDLSRLRTMAHLMLNWVDIVAQLNQGQGKALRRDVDINGVWYSLTIQSVPGVDRVRIYATNIDERKKSEKALKETNEKLASLNEELASSEEKFRASNEELSASNEEFRSTKEELRAVNAQEQEQANRRESLIHKRTVKLHESEKWLKETPHYARSLIEASLDPLVTISAEGKITDVNEATIRVTGVPREKLIGSDFSNYFTDPENARAGYRKVFEEGYVKDYALTIRNKSGKLTDVLYNATVYRNRAGEVAGIFAAARDVTEKNQLVERLKRAEVIGAVEQMGATVAHDLRGPLGLIVQSVNLTKQDPSLTPRMLKLIEENAVRSLKMIAAWRSSTREVIPQPVKTDLGGLIKNVLDGSTIPGNVEVNTSIGEGLDSVSVDPDIMHRVIDNLVKNAVEVMPNGGKLSVNVERDGEHLIIRVGDTGGGIPEELRGRIFSPLYTTKSGGMGLGLTYCRRAVEAQGGSIDFESEVGKGTIFTIRLPIH